jgi:hypothetical protein
MRSPRSDKSLRDAQSPTRRWAETCQTDDPSGVLVRSRSQTFRQAMDIAPLWSPRLDPIVLSRDAASHVSHEERQPENVHQASYSGICLGAARSALLAGSHPLQGQSPIVAAAPMGCVDQLERRSPELSRWPRSPE